MYAPPEIASQKQLNSPAAVLFPTWHRVVMLLAEVRHDSRLR
jgi:hypothetical protein